MRADNSETLKMELCKSYEGQHMRFRKKDNSTQHAEDRYIVWNRLAKDNCAVNLYLPWQPNWPATMESCHQDYQNSTYRLEIREKLPESYPAIVWVLALTPYDRSCWCAWLSHQVQQFCSKLFTKKVNLNWSGMWSKFNLWEAESTIIVI